ATASPAPWAPGGSARTSCAPPSATAGTSRASRRTPSRSTAASAPPPRRPGWRSSTGRNPGRAGRVRRAPPPALAAYRPALPARRSGHVPSAALATRPPPPGWLVVCCLCTVDNMSLDSALLGQAKAAEARVIDAEHEAEVARADFHQAVRRLQLAGGSLREIA